MPLALPVPDGRVDVAVCCGEEKEDYVSGKQCLDEQSFAEIVPTPCAPGEMSRERHWQVQRCVVARNHPTGYNGFFRNGFRTGDLFSWVFRCGQSAL